MNLVYKCLIPVFVFVKNFFFKKKNPTQPLIQTETSSMGNCRSLTEDEKRNQEINKQLRKDAKVSKELVKLLLLGMSFNIFFYNIYLIECLYFFLIY